MLSFSVLYMNAVAELTSGRLNPRFTLESREAIYRVLRVARVYLETSGSLDRLEDRGVRRGLRIHFFNCFHELGSLERQASLDFLKALEKAVAQ